MNKVDTLIIKAKKAVQSKTQRFIVGFITYDHGKFIADGRLWNGLPRENRAILTEHDTEQAALEMLKTLYHDYPNTLENAQIFLGGYDLE